MPKKRIGLTLLALALLALPSCRGQGEFQPPTFGQATVGDDYFLANYTQLQEYWAALAETSDRIELVEIGKTSEGRPMMMAIITSPENHRNLARYKDISVRLARAEGITEEEAHALASEGKAVVWLSGGLHATEIVNSEALFWTAYQFASQNDPETMRILNDDIILLTLVNPDGMELTADWYMRDPDPTKRNMELPRLYHKYIGHDNNRDFLVGNLPETQAIMRVFWVDWIPQIMYDAHQSGPAGAIIFVPPFRDPFNYNYDALIPLGIDMVGAAMRQRFAREGKGGFASRNEASYSTWSNGMIRSATYFHNQIGMMSEISGNPTPMEIGLVLDRQLPHVDVPLPLPPQQVWHFRQSIDYILSAQRAVLDVASRNKDAFLFQIWQMGMNSIERGSRDNWTMLPTWIEEAKVAAADEATSERGGREMRVGAAQVVPSKYYDLMRTPERRDPRGYIIPSDQPDFLTATEFVNSLIRNGVEVHRATSAFEVEGRSYPAGSYVLKAAQAFRPELRDMMEPQDHPNDFAFPGGPPRPPYDRTGYTVAFQMGVQFDRILDPFEGPFEKLPIGEPIKVPAGAVVAPAQGAAVGYLLSHQIKDSFLATNRLLGAGEDVYWLKAPFMLAGKSYPVGTIFIPSKPTTRALLDALATEVGLTFEGTSTMPTGDAYKLRPVRVGLWDQYGGDIQSGWIRWMFEQRYEFTTFELVYPPQLDAGDLKAKYDVIVFTGGIPATDAASDEDDDENATPGNLPPEWADKVGTITGAKTIPQLKQFVEDGGTIIAIGPATNIAYRLGLPVENHLVERTASGAVRPLPSEKYFVPGALVTATVDNSNPLAYGMPDKVDVFFNRSNTFRLAPGAAARGAKSVAWYDGEKLVHSGWGWGQSYLQGGVGVVETSLGNGHIFLFGPEVTFRAEPHGTLPLFFNGIYYGQAESVPLEGAGGSTK